MNVDETLNSEFESLRAKVESELRRHAVVLVTSAMYGDGKSLAAIGLVESLSRSGYRVALVDANPGAVPRDAGASAAQPLRSFPVFTLSAGKDSSVASRDSLRRFLGQMRGDYDFTVIDGPPLLESSMAMLLAPLVDGVLLTVRLGRAPSEVDELMIRSLRNAKAHVVGVIGASSESIADIEPVRAVRYRGDSPIVMFELTAAGFASS
jgi:Mrp family chromosome partitioning ATPase